MAEIRYSDTDLEEFEALIKEKLAVAKDNYAQLQRALSHQDDNSTDDREFVELFEREAATLASLDHPGIPAYKEFFTLDTPSDRAFVLVQELVDGRTLGALVGSGERGSVADVAELARQLLAILAYLASRAPPVTHRDVKPENLVLEGGGWGGRATRVSR